MMDAMASGSQPEVPAYFACLLDGIDLGRATGLEIGPLMYPRIPRAGTRVLYADHADRDGLRAKYAQDPHVDPDRLVPIDVVWSDRPLSACLPAGTVLDYALASHVVEHVPDLVGWLGELAEVMRPGGRLALVIPDKRFTSDILRQTSRLNELLDAALRGYRRPAPWQILDMHLLAADVDVAAAWRGEIDPERLPRFSDPRGGLAMSRRALAGEYQDAHCWVFTPASFLAAMSQLAALDLLAFRCAGFFDTDRGSQEFRVSLERRGPELVADREAARLSFLAPLPATRQDPPEISALALRAAAARPPAGMTAAPSVPRAPAGPIAPLRHADLFGGIDLAEARGLEIGPLTSPCVPREGTRVLYADWTDQEGLRARYAGHPGVDPAQLAPVDVAWSGAPLAACLPAGTVLDYAVASHVIEHVPDFVGWLAELATVLRPGGRLILVVPDRRFTFDHLRPPSRLNEVLDAHLHAYRAPVPWQILDRHLCVAKVDAAAAWRGTVDPGRLQRSSDAPRGLAEARVALAGAYVEGHCWSFTPRSFLLLMAELAGLGLLRFRCGLFLDTAPGSVEFRLVLERLRDDDAAFPAVQAEFLAWAASAGDGQPPAFEHLARAAETERQLALGREAAQRLVATEAALAALRASTSWRLTAPLRAVARRPGRQG